VRQLPTGSQIQQVQPAAPSFQANRGGVSNVNPGNQRILGKTDGGWGAWGDRRSNQANGSNLPVAGDRTALRTDLARTQPQGGRAGGDIHNSRGGVNEAPRDRRVATGTDRTPKVESTGAIGPAGRVGPTEKPGQNDHLNRPERHDRVDSGAADQRQAVERRERLDRADRLSGRGPKSGPRGGTP
jgi:hypothetical protein